MDDYERELLLSPDYTQCLKISDDGTKCYFKVLTVCDNITVYTEKVDQFGVSPAA